MKKSKEDIVKFKRLLELLEEHKSLFYSGLCGFIFVLKVEGIISTVEHDELIGLIWENRPSILERMLVGGMPYGAYYFKCGNYKLRKRWIKLVILLNK